MMYLCKCSGCGEEFSSDNKRDVVCGTCYAPTGDVDPKDAEIKKLYRCARDFRMLAQRMLRATTEAKLRELAGHAVRIAEKAGVVSSPLRSELTEQEMYPDGNPFV